MTLNIGGVLSSGSAGLQPLSVAGHVAYGAVSSAGAGGTPHAHPPLGLVGFGGIGLVGAAAAGRSSSRVEMRPTGGASALQVSGGGGPTATGNAATVQMRQRRFSAGGGGFGHSLQQLLIDPSATGAVAAASTNWEHFVNNRSHLMPAVLVGRGAPRSGNDMSHVGRSRDAENVDNYSAVKAEVQSVAGRTAANATAKGTFNQPLSSRNSVLNKPFDNRE